MDVEQRARELLAAQCEIDGMPEAAEMVRSGTFKGDAADGYQTTMRAIIAALTPPEGHVVVTRNEAGQAVAVTRQDDEGRILSVIAELGSNAGWAAAADRELVAAELGVAKIDDSTDVAAAKLRELIDWHVSIAIDPAVNGGYVLVPVAVQKDAERYRWLKQCSREQYLLARGMFGLAEDAIDAVIRDESKEIKDGH